MVILQAIEKNEEKIDDLFKSLVGMFEPRQGPFFQTIYSIT